MSAAAAPAAARLSGPRRLLLIAPALILVGVFLVLPYLNIVVMSFRSPSTTTPYGDAFTIGNYTRVIGDAFYLGVLVQTLGLGFLVTAICLVLGYPVAYHLARTRSAWKGVLYTFVLSPLLVGVVVRTFGWLIILSNNGVANQALKGLGLVDMPLPLMNNVFGVVVALVHVLLPFMILPLLGNIQAIDPSIEAAARSLGASRFTAFRRITLPLSVPGIQAGTILVFVLTVSAYVTPLMLGGPQVKTMSILVVQHLIDTFQWPAGAALALIMALAGTATVAVYLRLTAPIARRLP